jgi:hypothetical protein
MAAIVQRILEGKNRVRSHESRLVRVRSAQVYF